MSEQPGRYQRSPNALIGSLLVVLLVIIGFVGLRSLGRGNQDVAVPSVDYAAAALQARAQGLVLAAAPEPLPKGWRATSVRYSGRPDPSWHVGILSDEQTYVAIEERRATPDAMAARFLDQDAQQGGAAEIDGVRWQTWTSGDGFALVRATGRDTLFVGGPAGRQASVELVGRLDRYQVQAAG